MGQGLISADFLHIVGVYLSELCSVHISGDSPLSADTIKGGIIILASNPHGGTIREAGGGREDHGSMSFADEISIRGRRGGLEAVVDSLQTVTWVR
jgi:hypothetical protein